MCMGAVALGQLRDLCFVNKLFYTSSLDARGHRTGVLGARNEAPGSRTHSTSGQAAVGVHS